MRPVNDQRVVVEYARVHRLVEIELFNEDIEDFGPDLLSHVNAGVDLSGRWWRHSWRLGNIVPRQTRAGTVTSIAAQFGWYAETPTSDAPPPYDESAHSWAAEPARVREGVLALFVVDVASQIVAITSLAGDVSVPGFCHALTDLLNQAEIQASSRTGGRRVRREWLVDRIDERGTFEAWVDSVSSVTRVSARFHLPNPRSGDDIDPVVQFLNELGAVRGSVGATNEDGLDPYGHPIMRAAIAMQENDYGTVTAAGERESGEPDLYASREHPTRDVLSPDPRDPQLSVAGLVVKMLRALADRVEQGMR